ncbi:MAG: hypothetical protein ACPGZP_03485, partial [Panacagrimonas sp.]
LSNAQAFAGNLVTEGLDDPLVLPVYEIEYPEWDCYPWMPEDFNRDDLDIDYGWPTFPTGSPSIPAFI